jgi:hypothetical protein
MTSFASLQRKYVRIATLALAIVAGFATSARATTLNFDDLSGTIDDMGTYNPYNGLNFTGFAIWAPPVEGNYQNGVVSPQNQIFAFSDVTATIDTASTPFTFNGAYMTYAWLPGLQVVVTGFNGATPVHTQTITLSNSAATLFTFNWTGLTSVTFAAIPGSATSDPFDCGTVNCDQFTIDDFSINNAVTTAVPEPASIGLVALGLGALARRRRRA